MTMKRTPIAVAASTSAIACTAAPPDAPSALRNRPELKKRRSPNAPPAAAHSTKLKPSIRPSVQTRSSHRSASGPKKPSSWSADAGESRRATARHGRQRSLRNPRAIRGSRLTRRGSRNATKNSVSISAIRIAPPIPATTRIVQTLSERRQPRVFRVKRETRLVGRLGHEAVERQTIAPYRDGDPGEFYYQRYGHPIQTEVEALLGELDGGEALLFPSGAGATTALVLGLLEPAQTIALAEGGYYGTGLLFAAIQ